MQIFLHLLLFSAVFCKDLECSSTEDGNIFKDNDNEPKKNVYEKYECFHSLLIK